MDNTLNAEYENMNEIERLELVLNRLGGHALYCDIYDEYQSLFNPTSNSWKASIRSTIERNSSDSMAFNGNNDLFCSIDGIGSGHWGLRKVDSDAEVDLTQDDVKFCEGRKLLKMHIIRERNPKLIYEAKKRFKESNGSLYCEICGFNFEEKYGKLGADFIEGHHIKRVSEMRDGEKTDINDIVMLCSNCHSMIHRKKPWVTRNNLKKIFLKK